MSETTSFQSAPKSAKRRKAKKTPKARALKLLKNKVKETPLKAQSYTRVQRHMKQRRKLFGSAKLDSEEIHETPNGKGFYNDDSKEKSQIVRSLSEVFDKSVDTRIVAGNEKLSKSDVVKVKKIWGETVFPKAVTVEETLLPNVFCKSWFEEKVPETPKRSVKKHQHLFEDVSKLTKSLSRIFSTPTSDGRKLGKTKTLPAFGTPRSVSRLLHKQKTIGTPS